MKIKICGVPYTVRVEEDKFKVDHDGEGASLWGQISYEKHSINIRKGLPERELRTLLHEVLHGIIEDGEIRELMDSDRKHLEVPINQLANGLAEALESVGFKFPFEE